MQRKSWPRLEGAEGMNRSRRKRQGFRWMLDVTAGLLKVKVVVRGRGGR